MDVYFNMAPEVGIEPTITESKSGVLPLHYSGTKILLYKFLKNVVDFSTHVMIVSNGDALVNLFFLYVVNKQHIRKNPQNFLGSEGFWKLTDYFYA